MNISVIIPLYNAEKYISKALNSCLQFEEVKEVIVIDDAYPDKAVEIVKDLMRKDARIKLLAHPGHENRGAGASRNVGIKNATQEFIAFLDADDFYLPNRFDKDKEIFKMHPDADGCYNALGTHFYSEEAKDIFFKRFGSEITTVSEKCNPTPRNLFRGQLGFIKEGFGYFSLDTLTLKKEILIKTKLLFNERLRLHQDTEFIFKLSYYGLLYPSSISVPVALRGVHDDNRITATFLEDERKRNYKQFLLWKSLLNWAKDEKIKDREVFHLFKDNYDYYRMLDDRNPKPLILFKEIISNYDILRNKNYRKIHRLYTRSMGDRMSFGFLRIKNALIKGRG